MRWQFLKLSLERPYNQLLFILISIVSIGVIFKIDKIETIIVSFILLSSLLQVLKITRPSQHISRLLLGLTIVTFGTIVTNELGGFQFFPVLSILFRFITLLSSSLFLGVVITLLIQTLLRQSQVTADLVKGGICIYLLIAILWSILYQAIAVLDSQAFLILPEHQDNNPFVYFSFITLTSTGFGDIVPINPVAKLLAGFEAMFGQLYLAIVIARLVSLYSSQNSPRA
ncbi:potassium channel family protein [Synechococcus elongatus PCC 11802]|nr:potassium channel family protein [Synechococcus elongatus]AZB73725.1 two pore domain potassium channel family protein [Synechococcus elongatus PCC 11801]QFZ92942.1 two pore domain potassium channel family protein [Synechococcus elongatus PCC 11802]